MAVESENEIKQMNKSLKSKRNSRYKYGRRRSRSLGGIISTELCKTIDIDLPPAKRLKLLVEYSLKNAFQIAEREFDISANSEKYNEKVSECLKNIDSDLKKKDLYNSSFSGKKSLSEQVVSLDEYNEASAKFDKECAEWDNLIANERIALDAAKDESPMCTFEGSFDCKAYDKLNYTKLSDDVSLIVENYNYQVDKITTLSKKLNTYVELVNKLAARSNKEAADNFSRKIPHTPRTLIKRLKKS